MNGSTVQNFPKFENLRKFLKNQVILLKIWPKIGPIGIWMGHFFLKNGICMGLLSNSAAARHYQNQTWVPPRVKIHQL